ARIDLESRLSHDAEKAIAELVFRQGADVLGIQPDRFRIKHLLGRSSRLLEIDDRIGPIDTLKREGIDQFRNAHLLAIVLGRPPQQAQKIDECVWQEASVSVGGYADHGAVPPFGQFGTVGRDQQGEMSELRRGKARGLKDKHVLEGVRKMVLAANDVIDTQVDVVGARGEVVGRHAVAAQQGKILNISRRFGLLAIDAVVELDLLVVIARNSKTQSEWLSGRRSPVALRAREV